MPGDCCTDRARAACASIPDVSPPAQACTAKQRLLHRRVHQRQVRDSPDPGCRTRVRPARATTSAARSTARQEMHERRRLHGARHSCDADVECCSQNCLGERLHDARDVRSRSCVPAGSPATDASQCCSKPRRRRLPARDERHDYACTTLGESCGTATSAALVTARVAPASRRTRATHRVTFARGRGLLPGMCSPGGAAPRPLPRAVRRLRRTACLASASNCCTRRCVDLGSGTKVCQPPAAAG